MKRDQRFQVTVGEHDHEVRIKARPPRQVLVDGIAYNVCSTPRGDLLVHDTVHSTRHRIVLDHPTRPSQASLQGQRIDLTAQTSEAAALAKALLEGSDLGSNGRLEAPMPGRVVKVLLTVGQSVQQGDPAIIVEAMKMENELHSPLTGTVREIAVAEGDVVESGALLCEIETPLEER